MPEDSQPAEGRACEEHTEAKGNPPIHHSFSKLFWVSPALGTEASEVTQTRPCPQGAHTAPQGCTLRNGHFKTSVVNALGVMGALESPVRPGGWGVAQSMESGPFPLMLILAGLEGAPFWSQGDMGSKPGSSANKQSGLRLVTYPL